MRRSAVLLLVPFLLAAPAGAAEPSANTVLHLSETAERVVKRDRLRAELRVEVTGASPRAVQGDINRRMTAALERVRAQPTVKSETGAHSVWEERPQNAPARWRGMQSLILTGRETGELLDLVGELQGDGLLLNALQHELAPETARGFEDELTQQAIQRLRERAEKVAKSMGLTIGRWKKVRVGNVGGQPPYPPVPIRAAMVKSEAMPAPVAEPGETPVRVTIDAEIVLQPSEERRP